MYPRASNTEAPEHAPQGIAKDFEDASDCLRRRSLSAAGIMFRRVLERATLELAEDKEAMRSRKLFGRIETLADERILAPAMEDPARAIRLEGNEAAREDEEFDEPRAWQMAEFAELFLLYRFTLPERVKRARGEAAAD
ncbi:MAG: DUF4145 domain-containing protein [Chloroflexi bacterium]|nr:DUF4145 domain-containing protein [Chloroflexota bacterium]